SNPVEATLAGIFTDVLDIDRVGADDGFFDLGGDSLTATQLVARVNATFDTDIGLQVVFETHTVAGLAGRIEQGDVVGATRPVLIAGPRPTRVPVSPAQQRMWYVNQLDTSSPAYNIPMVVRLVGAVDVAALREAIGDVLERHEALRTMFPDSEDGPTQVVVPVQDAMPDLTPIPVPGPAALRERITWVVSGGFDVTRAVPMRAGLFEVGDTEHVLAVVMHHILADGYSMTPLIRDMSRAYGSRACGQAPGWAPLAVQYVDYTLWQRELLGSEDDPQSVTSQQLDYWRSVLRGAPPVLALPVDRPRSAVRSARGGQVVFSVDTPTHSALAGLACEHGATVFMVAHAAFAVLLARICSAEEVVVGTPVAGRGE
ncbi:MAG: condensation domain-containing protein, partial [Actinomycetes bacterium]